jgi:hypothetical protein
MDEMKFCKDCRWFVKYNDVQVMYGSCGRTTIVRFHPVSGESWDHSNRCSFERGLPNQGPGNTVRDDGLCGPEGRFWEAKVG